MYGLKLPTDPRWVDMASMQIEDILTDHAYCEQKAASTGISLIQQFPDKTELVDALMPVVAEEWGHFKMVVDQLKSRGLSLGRQRKDEYVAALMGCMKKTSSREEMLLEKLLVAAMIEARSCERFRLLSLNISDTELREFYKRLMVSEAGHYKLFLDLAILYHGKDKALNRWSEYLEMEAEIMYTLSLRGDRMH